MSYSGLQNKLLEDSVIESFLLESVTPVRIGGYNAQPYSSKLGFDFFRTSSVKGVWRWWARALISGALIELGKSPPPKISDLNRQFLDPLLGSTSSASKITIRLIPHEANMSRQEPKDLDIPRIKLITMGRQEKIFNEKYPIGLRFSIELIKRCKISDLEERFAYSSLILAFLLGGLGSIANRGFGKFKVKMLKHNDQKKLDELYASRNEKEISDRIKSIINKFVDYTKEYVKEENSNELNKLKSWRNERLPPYPSVATIDSERHFFRCESILILDDWKKALQCIGDTTLKAKWKTNYRESGMPYHTWILGLPRSQGGRGYKFKDKIERRQSSIGFSVLSHEGLYSIIMYGFLTKDWEEVTKSLQHIGRIKRNVVDLPVRFPKVEKRASSPEELVNLAFEAAWEYAKMVILKKKYTWGRWHM